VGGRSPGSVSSSNADIFQEGLRVPPIKMARRGKLNPDFLRIFLANTRTPEVNLGDFKALIAALDTGANRTQRLIERYGADDFIEGQALVQDYAEK
jgi:N-methylhydantoinase B